MNHYLWSVYASLFNCMMMVIGELELLYSMFSPTPTILGQLVTLPILSAILLYSVNFLSFCSFITSFAFAM